ncbi:AAA family ATPase [Nocardiopsis sp. N85]|uniref:AAA family ATPase n=1 Tax=Nocardiopsis sp. N85 TaxID=3029400 RepID=UPI00237F2033|nr:AAA family ATPase [Nocardiopsis sp. N85]MDE3725339.1 AAA family ATPase [Nocardiopsis sp. N85]
MTALDRVRDALDAHGHAPHGDTQLSARCPAHEDRAPSLSVGYDGGKVLVSCKAGCDVEDVVAALGLRMADLFDEDVERRPECDHRRPWKTCDLVASYHYADEAGEVLYTQRRYRCRACGAKTFLPHNPKTRKAGLPRGVRVLYNLPAVVEAARAGGTVVVVEGEKDADRLNAMGHVATTNVNGAAARWEDSYTDALRGAHVVIIADNDGPGIGHARKIAQALDGAAASVRVLRSPLDRKGADVSDHLAHGLTLDDLVPLDEAPAEDLDEVPADDAQDDETTGDPVADRLAALRALLIDSAGLDNIPPPEPIIDSVLFRDSLAWLHGKPGHGKSFVALDWAGSVAVGRAWQGHHVTRPGGVVYLVAEGVTGVRQRVRAWEAAAGTPMTGVRFLPVAVQLLSPIDRDAFVALVAELRPVLIIIDTQARVTVGADENSAQDMGRLVAAADALREQTSACVLLVHHEARAGDTLRGSTALEGAAHTLIRAHKDGPTVRIDCMKQKDAEPFPPLLLRLVPRGPGAVLESHSGMGPGSDLSPTDVKLLGIMRDSFGTTGATGAQLRETSEIPKSSFYRALNTLVERGLVVNTGTDKRPFYVLPEDTTPKTVPTSPTGAPETSPKSHTPTGVGPVGLRPPRRPRAERAASPSATPKGRPTASTAALTTARPDPFHAPDRAGAAPPTRRPHTERSTTP